MQFEMDSASGDGETMKPHGSYSLSAKPLRFPGLKIDIIGPQL